MAHRFASTGCSESPVPLSSSWGPLLKFQWVFSYCTLLLSAFRGGTPWLQKVHFIFEETVKPSLLRRTASLVFEKRIFLPEFLNSLHKLRCPLGLPDLFGSSGSISEAFEVSGVPLLLPPKGGSGLSHLSQVTATGWGLSKVEDFKDPPFFESPWILESFPMALPVEKPER